jgi:formamidopyrimidine-DNA glycosylase
LRVNAAELQARFDNSRREVKVALLDQRALAGIGNLYASEILHVAGINPQKRCDQLTGPMWAAIHEAMLDVLNTAIKYEGSTLGDGTYRNALNKDGSYQNQHRVYMRESEKCLSCKQGSIKKIVQAQRSTFFCPKCQTKSRWRAKK